MDDHETPQTRIRFGDQPTDDMPAEWAERGLRWLRAKRPDVFGDMMLAIVGIEHAGRGRRRGADGQQ